MTISLQSKSEELVSHGPQTMQSNEPSVAMEFRAATDVADKQKKQHVSTQNVLPPRHYSAGPTQRRFLQQYAKSSSVSVPYYNHHPPNSINLQSYAHQYHSSTAEQRQQQLPTDHRQQTQHTYSHVNLQVII